MDYQFALVELFLLIKGSVLDEWLGEFGSNCMGISFSNLNLLVRGISVSVGYLKVLSLSMSDNSVDGTIVAAELSRVASKR